jgi:serine/threonine-protein kinase
MGALALAILAERPPPIPALRPDADPILLAAIDRAMTRDALHRFQSARQMREALSGNVSRPLVAGQPVAAARPPTMVLTSPPPMAATFAPMPMPAPRRNRPTRRQTLMGVAAVLALILAGILIFTDSPPPTPRPATTSTPVPTTTTTTTTSPPPTASEVVEQPEGPKKDKKGGPGKKGRGEGHGGN